MIRRHGFDDVGAGLALDRQDDRPLIVVPAGDQLILSRADGAADIADADRRSVAIGDDEVGVLVGLEQLIVGIEREGLARAVERALGKIDVRLAEHRADILEVDAASGQRLRIDLYADGRLLRTSDADEADAGYLRDLLQQNILRIGVDNGQRQAVRGDAENQNRRVCRVDLSDQRRIRQACRQVGVRGIDGRQRVADGPVDLAIQLELQGDLGVAERARGRHLGEARDLPELQFERRSHRGGHGLRIGARQLRGDGKRRIVDVRQRRDRQQRIGDQTAHQQGDHQQRGRDRPIDKGCGNVHGIGACRASCAASSCAALPCRIVTCAPGCSLYCPSTTTCSLAWRPESISAWPSLICATLTWPDCHGVVWIDDIGVGPGRTLLHDACGNGQAVVPGIDEQSRVDELARPEPARLVGKIGLELDRAGGLQDLVVDEAEHALIQQRRIILIVGKDRERRLGLLLLLLDLRQDRLRKREDQRNRIELRDDDEAVRGRRADDVADVDLTNPDHAIDRRRQARVAELHLRRIDQCLIGLDGRHQLPDLRLLGFEQLRSGPALLPQCGVAGEIGLGVDELGLIALEIGRVLIDQGLVGTRIDLREQVAGMNGLAFGEVDADDLPLDLGAHDVGVVRDHRADAGKIDWHVMLGDRCGDDRHRRWGRRGIGLFQGVNMRRSTTSRRPQARQSAATAGITTFFFMAILARS